MCVCVCVQKHGKSKNPVENCLQQTNKFLITCIFNDNHFSFRIITFYKFGQKRLKFPK